MTHRPPGSIIVVGSANHDTVISAETLPRPGETVVGKRARHDAGGKGLNQAIAASRMGGEVGFVGAVGGDEAGRFLAGTLESAGVGLDHLFVSEAASGSAYVTVSAAGENSIVCIPGANDAWHLSEHAVGAISSADYVLTQLEIPLPIVEQTLAIAAESGTRTVLTPAPAANMRLDLLGTVWLLVLNEGEARALSGSSVGDPAAMLSPLVPNLIITRGSRGSSLYQHNRAQFDCPAVVVDAIDTTAAGDTFTGALVADISLGATFEAAIRFASRAAALCVQLPGSANSIPSRSSVTSTSTGAVIDA
jgi:ribokinase